MAKKPETRLQKNIRSRLEAVGGVWYKIHGGPYQHAGIPDFIGCIDGRFFGLEVKVPGLGKKSEPSELQKIEIGRIKLAGGTACVVTSPEEAVRVVREALARAKRRS